MIESEIENLNSAPEHFSRPNNRAHLNITFLLSIVAVFFFLVLIFAVGYFLGDSKNKLGQTLVQESSSQNNTSIQHELKGVVALKEGTLEIQRNSSWSALEKGGTVVEGNVLRTGSNSRAVIELDDGSAVRLDQSTEVTFSNLSDEVILLTQQNGRVYHRVQPGKLLYNVKSLETVANALGTSFAVNTDLVEQKTEVTVFESKVAILTKAEETAKTEVSSGEVATIDKEQKVIVATIAAEELQEDFYQWNQNLNQASAETTAAETPTATPTPTPEPAQPVTTPVSETPKEVIKTEPAKSAVTGALSLTAQAKEGGVLLSWTFSGSAPYGYKLAASTNANPTYPPREGDIWQYISTSETKSYTWTGLTAGTTYHFRVGTYNGSGGVVTYSNDVTAVPLAGATATESSAFTGQLTLSVVSQDTGKATLTWTVTGGEIKNGFKACFAEHANPVYPTDNCTYKNTADRIHEATGLTPGKTYHFRVGVYGTSGGVVAYSNDIAETIK